MTRVAVIVEDWVTGLQIVQNWKPYDPKRRLALEDGITLQIIQLITKMHFMKFYIFIIK